MKAAFKGTNSSVQPSWMEFSRLRASQPASRRGGRGCASGVTAITGQMANVDVHELAWIFFSLSNVGFTGLKEILNEHLNNHASAFIRDISSISVLYN